MVDLWNLHIISPRQRFDESLLKIFRYGQRDRKKDNNNKNHNNNQLYL